MSKDQIPAWLSRNKGGPRIGSSEFERTLLLYKDGLALGLAEANSGGNRRTAIDYAAEKLGLHRETVRQRLAWGPWFTGREVPGVPAFDAAWAGRPKSERVVEAEIRRKAGIRIPKLPAGDRTGEEEVEAAIADYERRRAAEMARRWMEFGIEGDEPFGLAFVGDPHLDDPHTDLSRLKADVERIGQTRRMWAVGLGDYVNGWRGKLTRKYADQRVTERGAYAMAKWLFDKPIWMMLIQGNHDAWAGGGSPLEWMMAGTDAPMMEWEVRFKVEAPGASWGVWAAHDFPGTSQWNILHGPLKRAMMTGAVADVFIAGDKHSYGVLHTQHEHTGKPYWICRARGYKMQDPYSRQCGYGEHDIGHTIVAVFDPRTKKIQCFDDVETGAKFLEFLQETAP